MIVSPARTTVCRLVATSLLVLALPGHAQLPAPSRTIYKCEVNGKIAYTDEPCLGAQRLDVVPTRGVDKLSGQVRTGADVAREHYRESMARAVQPLTGMNPQQYSTQVRRHQLDAGAQRECRVLEADILDNEALERRGGARETIASLQQDTLALRQRYHKLRC